METQSKPRVSPQQYEEMMKRNSAYAQGSIADLIERFMRACPDMGLDHRYRYRKLQRQPIAALLGNAYKREDVIEFAQARRLEVSAPTVMHDIVCLSNVLKYAGSGVWKDTRTVSAAELIAAKPFLVREGLMGKSQSRDRRPQLEEVVALLAYFAMQNENDRTLVDMVLLTRWQIASSRRIGESCKLLWVDWRFADQTILVRKMKDPKKKNKQKVVALPPEAQAMFMDMAYEMNERPELRTDEPRIFPFNSRTASARYTMAKMPGAATPEGIFDLHLHDCRRECASVLLELGYTVRQVMMVTGHERETGALNVYTKPDPATFKNGPLGQRVAA